MKVARLAPSEIVEQFTMGNYAFSVITTDNWKDGKTVFYITTRFPLRRNGLRDRVSASLFAIGGRPTRRGLELFDQLKEIDGVQPSLDEINRQLLILVVTDNLIDNEHWARDTLKGLPLNVALILQTVSMGS